jgi:hypothetical protein
MRAILTSAIAANLATTKPGLARQNNNNQGGVSCLLRGTTIRTGNGDRKIEELALGDFLPTLLGGLRPIQWIGRYPFRKSDPRKLWVKDVLPVCVVRSALAPNVPHADLYLTQAHALLIDGVLIPVGNLINGKSIKLHMAYEHNELEFFHIKLESHDVIYAEGCPVETLLNVDECAVNFADYFRRHGAPVGDETRCAPFLSYGGICGELNSRVHSALLPWLDRREQIDVIRDRLEERFYNMFRP